jgi:Flp pilus assembly protein TadD
MLMRTKIPADRYVRAVEFRPGSAPVHHAVVHLDPTDASRRKDGADGQAGFEGMGGDGTEEPAGHFVGWAPGRGPIVSAEGMPWKLAAGTDLVVELHLIPQKAPVSVQPSIALYFADGPPAASPLVVKMGARVIDIPPGATDYAVTDHYLLPVDVRVLSLYPHAHYLGKEMAVQATLPDGSTRVLLQIPRWSFHWQQDYRFVQPVALPRGTTLAMRFTYDNSDGNADNPHHPPVRVVMGQRSTDEMGNLLLQVVTESTGDRQALQHDIDLRDAARALEFDGDSWQAQNDMGAALMAVNRAADAVKHFGQAVRLKPDPLLHFNLAKALLAAGSPEPAGAALRRALALNPRLTEAHNELGVLLFAQGRLPDALVHLREAVRLAPNSAIAHSDLGGALAQAGRREEALVHLRRALALDPRNAAAAENLARLRGGR